jgi:hypothetical protein
MSASDYNRPSSNGETTGLEEILDYALEREGINGIVLSHTTAIIDGVRTSLYSAYFINIHS